MLLLFTLSLPHPPFFLESKHFIPSAILMHETVVTIGISLSGGGKEELTRPQPSNLSGQALYED